MNACDKCGTTLFPMETYRSMPIQQVVSSVRKMKMPKLPWKKIAILLGSVIIPCLIIVLPFEFSHHIYGFVRGVAANDTMHDPFDYYVGSWLMGAISIAGVSALIVFSYCILNSFFNNKQ